MVLFLSVSERRGEVRSVHVAQQRLQRPLVAAAAAVFPELRVELRRVARAPPAVRFLGGQCAGLRGVKPLDRAGQPDQPLETLDGATAIMHQLMLCDRPSAAQQQLQRNLKRIDKQIDR